MKDINPIKGKYYIDDLISQGEHEHQDFKFMISDARKIARSISAFANNGGGRLLIGVKDNGVVAGVRNEEDIYVVEQAAQRYCRPAQDIEFSAFNVGAGTVVIRASISAASRRPVYANDTDGKWKAFYRVADENIVAHPLMVRAWERRESSSDDALLFRLSDAESRMLEMLDIAQGKVGVRDIALSLHVAMAEAEDMVVRLAALGIITFSYAGNGEFSIVRETNDDDICG